MSWKRVALKAQRRKKNKKAKHNTKIKCRGMKGKNYGR